VASASDGGTVVVQNLADPAAPVITATLRFTIPPSPSPGPEPDVALTFSADGRTLTTIAGNTAVTLWNVTGHCARAASPPSPATTSVKGPWRRPPGRISQSRSVIAATEPVPLEYSIDRLICAFASTQGAVMVG
jgi:hypothetical protein